MKLRILILTLILSLLLGSALGAGIDVYQYTGYVYVEAGGQYRWYPLAKTPEESYSFSITQPAEDGGAMVNTIHITDTAVYMEASTCENQDCVEQGEVTLENMEFRILSNYIICLPHQVIVQLFTPDEFYQWYVTNIGEEE